MEENNQKISAVDSGEVSTARLEILTDGIFAFALYFWLDLQPWLDFCNYFSTLRTAAPPPSQVMLILPIVGE